MCFLKFAVMFLKNFSIDDNHKTTHKQILFSIFVLVLYLYGSLTVQYVYLYIYLVRINT